jgi:hypothetical protein
VLFAEAPHFALMSLPFNPKYFATAAWFYPAGSYVAHVPRFGAKNMRIQKHKMETLQGSHPD